jgi:hypothetical protein
VYKPVLWHWNKLPILSIRRDLPWYQPPQRSV